MNTNSLISGKIGAVAGSRWLYVSEIEKLLDQDLAMLPIQKTPPRSPPTSGTLLLYDRSVTRNYKSDGHDWIKKRNSHKVREDHVKLRVGGKFRVSGCYVHSTSILSFHRRAYHLLNPDTGSALHPVGNSNDNTTNRTPSLVLVHYLDTKVASEHLNSFVVRGVDVSESLWPTGDESTSRRQIKGKARSQQPRQLKMTIQQQQQVPSHPIQFIQAPQAHHYQHLVHQHQFTPTTPIYSYVNEDGQNTDNLLTNAIADSSHALDNNTLDFLWDVIAEDGQDKNLHSSNLSELLVPGVFEQILERPGAQNLFENREMLEMAQSASFSSTLKAYASKKIEDKVNFSACAQIEQAKSPSRNQSMEKTGHEDSPSHSDSKQTSAGSPIPDLIDMTPDMIDFNKSAKVVVSFNAGAIAFDDDDRSFACKYLLAFLKVNGNNLLVRRVHGTKMLNPFCFQCQIKPGFISPGTHKAILLGAQLERDFSESELIVRANKLLAMALPTSNVDLHLAPITDYPALVEKDIKLRIFSNLSECQFHCIGNSKNDESSSHSSTTMKEHLLGDLPAPPPAMALVATVLSDFPSPPPEAVLQPSDSDENITQQVPNGLGNIEVVSDDNDNRGSLTSASNSNSGNEPINRKRTGSFFDRSDTNNTANISIANKWAMQTSSDPESDTKAEAVDRHCKIRFVEKLTSVISETRGESLVQETLPDSVMTTVAENDGTMGTVVDTEEMKGMDDDQLDRILDSLLVRIVETLVEMSPSECNVEDLTATDKSGFTLLHYAALYNLQSLIPVLLSRGANPDVQSVRGAVTPLHLACGAGNEAIVELLIRNGCAMKVPDSFGSYPVDHAYRNGFTSLACMLEEKMAQESGLTNSENSKIDQQTVGNDTQRKETLKEIERYRLQNAFENLSLKDKMVLNMILKQRKKRAVSSKPKTTLAAGTIPEEENSGDEGDVEMKPEPITDVSVLTEKTLKLFDDGSQGEGSGGDSDDISSVVISETDRESLTIAMRLMNDGELEELQNKSADIHKDLKNWMLKRNYESLKEASEYLHKTLNENKAEAEKASTGTEQATKNIEKDFKQQAKIRSLKNMKSQALAALVLRKKLLALREREHQYHPKEK